MRTPLVVLTAVACAIVPATARQPVTTTLEVLPVQGQVHVVAGATSNVVVQAGADGVLVVDAAEAADSDAVLAAIRSISRAPLRYVVNTHGHRDHTGGNAAIARAGSPRGGGTLIPVAGFANQAPVLAHEQVLTRLSGATRGEGAAPSATWPTDTFFTGEKQMFFNDEGIQLLHAPRAHTDGDVVVFFRRSDVIAAGDVFSTEGFPAVDAAAGGTVQGTIDALNRLIDLTIPREKQEAGTYVVPGHGRIGDESDVVEYRDMVTIVRDRVAHLVRQGRSREQVHVAGLTRDYDGRYPGRPDSGRAFVEAAYVELARTR